MKLYSVLVKPKFRHLYYTGHKIKIGYIIEKEHDFFWFRFIEFDGNENSYIGIPNKYYWNHIIIQNEIDKPNDLNSERPEEGDRVI